MGPAICRKWDWRVSRARPTWLASCWVKTRPTTSIWGLGQVWRGWRNPWSLGLTGRAGPQVLLRSVCQHSFDN